MAKKKKSYLVTISVTVPILTVLLIGAEDETSAGTIAKEQVLKSRDYVIHDFDGNRIEVLPRDVKVVEVIEEEARA